MKEDHPAVPSSDAIISTICYVTLAKILFSTGIPMRFWKFPTLTNRFGKRKETMSVANS